MSDLQVLTELAASCSYVDEYGSRRDYIFVNNLNTGGPFTCGRCAYTTPHKWVLKRHIVAFVTNATLSRRDQAICL